MQIFWKICPGLPLWFWLWNTQIFQEFQKISPIREKAEICSVFRGRKRNFAFLLEWYIHDKLLLNLLETSTIQNMQHCFYTYLFLLATHSFLQKSLWQMLREQKCSCVCSSAPNDITQWSSRGRKFNRTASPFFTWCISQHWYSRHINAILPSNSCLMEQTPEECFMYKISEEWDTICILK